MAASNSDPLAERLDTVICLLAAQVGEGQPIGERAARLQQMGLTNPAIARALGTTPDSIRAQFSKRRRAPKRLKRAPR